MRTQLRVRRLGIAMLLGVTMGLVSPCLAGQPFVDDFEDGSATDGSPVTWSVYPSPYDSGTIAVTNGDLVLTPGNKLIPGFDSYYEIDAVVEERLYHNVDVHAAVRALGTSLSVMAVGALDTYFTDGLEGVGVYGYIRSDTRELVFQWSNDTTITRLGARTLPFSQASQDINLRLTVHDDLASLTAWREGDLEPSPQITATLPDVFDGLTGRVTIAGGSSTTRVPMAFHSVTVVPEPSAGAAFGRWASQAAGEDGDACRRLETVNVASNEGQFPQLLAEARQGSLRAQGELLERYRKFLKTLVRLQWSGALNVRADASDVVQETFLRAHETFPQFRGQTEQELAAWMRAILASRLAKSLRHHLAERRSVELERRLYDELERSSTALDRAFREDGPGPSEVAWHHERAIRLASAIEDLSDDYRTVILSHHIRGLPYAEVGRLMGRSTEAVRKLWVRALAELQRKMESMQ